jgi:GT2 family glycosyltransferase
MDGDRGDSYVKFPETLDELVPVIVGNGAPDALFKIDQLAVSNGHLVLTGWCSHPDLDLKIGGPGHLLVMRYERPDVARELGQPKSVKHGLCLLLSEFSNDEVTLSVGQTSVVLTLSKFDVAHSVDVSPELSASLFETMSSLKLGAPMWQTCQMLMPAAPQPAALVCGALDHVIGTAVGTVVAGWVVHDQRSLVWIETHDGQALTLEKAYWHDRPDVRAHDPGLNIHDPKIGFLCDIQRSGASFKLCGATRKGHFQIAAKDRGLVGGPLASVAKRLFEISTPRLDLAKRFEAVDLPHLSRLKQQTDVKSPAPKSSIQRYGKPPKTAAISIIVPLYGRIDLIEHQLLAFTLDDDFADQAEVIYVLDDPTLEMGLRGQAPVLHSICGMPFSVVSNGRNNGFANACNIGAEHARGETLIFMNSDVFPIQSGWAGGLAEALAHNSEIGIVSPRLLFPDGGIQHAGMKPKWRPALNIWSNLHPNMGFDPDLDPNKELAPVPLVSGACVAMRRRDFDAVDGWSTDYIVGDYEDSDLCLKLRELGLGVAYDPQINLTHMERQSLPHAGEASFREYITLLNGLRYSRRWHNVLKEMHHG